MSRYKSSFPEFAVAAQEEMQDILEDVRAASQRACATLDGARTATAKPLVMRELIAFATTELLAIQALPEKERALRLEQRILALRMAAD